MGNMILSHVTQSGGGHQEVGWVRKVIAIFWAKTPHFSKHLLGFSCELDTVLSVAQKYEEDTVSTFKDLTDEQVGLL